MAPCPAPLPPRDDSEPTPIPMDLTRRWHMQQWLNDIDRVDPAVDMRPLMKSLVTQLFVQRELAHRLVGQDAREVFDYIVGYQAHPPFEEAA